MLLRIAVFMLSAHFLTPPLWAQPAHPFGTFTLSFVSQNAPVVAGDASVSVAKSGAREIHLIQSSAGMMEQKRMARLSLLLPKDIKAGVRFPLAPGLTAEGAAISAHFSYEWFEPRHIWQLTQIQSGELVINSVEPLSGSFAMTFAPMSDGNATPGKPVSIKGSFKDALPVPAAH